MQEEKKEEHMDEAEDLYVASDLYEEDDVETGIRRGASPTRDGAPSPPRVPRAGDGGGQRHEDTQDRRVKNESVIFSSPPPE